MERGGEGERWEREREEKGRDGQGTTGMGRDAGRDVKGWQGKGEGCEWEGESTSPSHSHSYLLMPISSFLHSLPPSPPIPPSLDWFVRSFVCSSVRPCVCSFIRSFVRPLAH